MSKVEKTSNPFAQFNTLRGQFVPPEDDETKVEDVKNQEDEVKTGLDDAAVVEDEATNDEQANLDKGTKLIEEQIKKQEALKAKKKASEEISEESEEDTQEEEIVPENEIEEPLKAFVDNWYNKGVIDFNSEDETFEPSEEGLEKLIDKTVNSRIEKWSNNLDPEYRDFLEYVQQGGRPKDFLDVYYGNYSWENYNIESDEAKRTVIREAYLLAGDSQEDIDEMLLEWETNGSLEKRAKSALTKMQKHEINEKAELLEKQKAFAEAKKKQEKAQWDSFKENLMSKEDLMGFKLTPKTKEKLWDFITVPDKRTGKTGYQMALEKNKDSELLFALQAMQGFNIKDLEKQVQTKVSNKLSTLLKNTKDTGTKQRISSGHDNPHIDDNPFEAFKAAKL